MHEFSKPVFLLFFFVLFCFLWGRGGGGIRKIF